MCCACTSLYVCVCASCVLGDVWKILCHTITTVHTETRNGIFVTHAIRMWGKCAPVAHGEDRQRRRLTVKHTEHREQKNRQARKVEGKR